MNLIAIVKKKILENQINTKVLEIEDKSFLT